MRFNFLYLNVTNGIFTGAEYEINCSYIRSFLATQNINTQQIIYQRENSLFTMESLVEFVYEQIRDDALVIYINEYNYYATKTFIKLFHEKYSNILISFGTLIDNNGYNHAKDLPIDYFLTSDPAYALLRLNEDGIPERKNSNEPKTLCYEERIPLHKIPHPYSNNILPCMQVFNVGMYTSRGCMGKCCFCSYSTNCKIEMYTIESIIDELLYIYTNVGKIDGIISFLDDCFSVSSLRTKELCKRISELNLPYEFWCTTRADLLTEDLLDELKKANFNNISIGMETASPKLLSTIGKTLKYSSEEYLEQIIHKCRYTKQIGLNLTLTVMLLLPGEQIDDIYKTLSFLNENNITNVSFNFMTLFPQSRLFLDYKEQGLVERSPYGLYNRTFGEEKNSRSLLGVLERNTLYYSQFIFTSNIKQLKMDFIEHITGMCSTKRISSYQYAHSIEFKELSDVVLGYIKHNAEIDTNIYYECDKIDKEMRVFCDDRKNLKLPILQHDSILHELDQNGIYNENLSLILNAPGMIKYKCKNYYEKSLLSLKNISIESPEFESYIIEHYNKFINSEFLELHELYAFSFRNACMLSNACSVMYNRRWKFIDDKQCLCNFREFDNSFTEEDLSKLIKQKNKKCENCEMYSACSRCPLVSDDLQEKICYIKKKCPKISDIVGVSNFIAKNMIGLKNGAEIFMSENSPLFFDKNTEFSNFYFICTDFCGFLYIPAARSALPLNVKEIALIKNARLNGKSLSGYPKLYRKLLYFVDNCLKSERSK